MNKVALKYIIFGLAIALAAAAAWFSIIGLSKLFAGAAIAVIIMASLLEASKLIVTSYLYQNWSLLNQYKILKRYLTSAVVVIAIVTSIGIYGFLSAAYQNTKSKYDLTKTQVDSLNVQKSYYDNAVVSFKNQLDSKNSQLENLTNIRNSQETRASILVDQKRASNSADRSARQTETDIRRLTVEIDQLNRKILAYSDSASKTQLTATKVGLQNDVASELGPLTYISRMFGISMDKVVNILMLLFVTVFDPLAIALVLAFNIIAKVNIESKPIESESKVDISDEVVQSPVDDQPKSEEVQAVTEDIAQNSIEADITTVQADNKNEATKADVDDRILAKRRKSENLYKGAVSI